MSELILKGKLAKEAAAKMRTATQIEKNNGLLEIAHALRENQDYILAENKKDLIAAKENGISSSMLDRLRLTKERIDSMVEGVLQILQLEDPIGEVLTMWERPNGLRIGKKRVPVGVIGIIYEARPNVTVDAAALCLKASNVTILKGGKEAFHSNLALVKVMREAIKKAGLPEDAVSLIEELSRETTVKFMKLNEYLDLLIPRGGAGLIQTVVQNATVPVIETGTGNCHLYVDESADFEKAIQILINAKVSRPSVCNACESLVVHERIAKEFLPLAAKALEHEKVEIRGCEKTRAIISCKEATEADFYQEYNDLILSVKVVSDLTEAIAHINEHNTGHSDAIITESYQNAQRFLNEVNAACVYVNASTRFTDGYEFGFGAEIGISTQMLHARGPMGLKELTSYKYIIYGDGQIR